MGTRKATLTILLVLTQILVSFSQFEVVNAQSNIIRIRIDGTVEGTNKIQRFGDIYTIIGDINSSVGSNEAFIFVEKDNIIIDGAGFTIRGSGFGTAINLLRKQNITIKNFNIENFETGINFWSVNNFPEDSKYWGLPPASNNKIINNSISVVEPKPLDSIEKGIPIYLLEAFDTVISDNIIISNNSKGGIFFGITTKGTTLRNNQFFGGGLYIRDYNQTTAIGNTVEGKPLIFLNGESNCTIDNAGLVYLFSCENTIIKNIQNVISGQTIQLVNTNESTIVNCEGYILLINSNNNVINNNKPKSISLLRSSNNKIVNNKILNSSICIDLSDSSNYNSIEENIISNNNIVSNSVQTNNSGENTIGIRFGIGESGGCSYNRVSWNQIINHDFSIQLSGSSNNIVFSNNILDSNIGISLSDSDLNRVFQNNITKCKCALDIRGSDNIFYNNNFLENQNQVVISNIYLFSSNIVWKYSTNNTFDSGNFLGGNFWSGYNGTDNNRDGIGDTPYIIDENNQDNYPLMQTVDIETISENNLTFFGFLALGIILLSVKLAFKKVK